ncbi:hypothetical protein N7532_001414 [Penicillium argentinense]|uniref:Protein kinase domain-containing protein n=1 Tax=Penicillium argentinense TaxID=1131581 RepID=A0A9W9KL83_9EURO|nr:uncharacterized protein N7532_001414 [Penicillium argentinense]KAJ5110879.1 hypothetical protein N7532_001414 [Penicillium argentinense]
MKDEARRSQAEIFNLGVVHEDLCPGNLLWNTELQRVFLIDFHDVTLRRRLKARQNPSKRKLCGNEHQRKRARIASVYQILRKAQASAVPVFLGTIDLAKIYFLHGAGQIRHMLIMGWGGESTATMELTQQLRREIHKSTKEIRALGIIHGDLRRDNVLWSEELGRALIIDFHRSSLRCRPTKQRPGAAKRRLCQTEASADAKRVRVSGE